jgi:magnesium-transporting ATPase (P-type)
MEASDKMAAHKKNVFEWRRFISQVLFLSFVLLVFSGLALYLRPEGSVARWTGWRILGLDKNGWEGVHTLFCITFFLASSAHLALNWKPLLRYLSGGIDKSRGIRRELVVAVGLVIAVLTLAILRIPPASKIMEWRSAIKHGSVVIQIQAPEPNFEKSSLKKISAFLGVSIDHILKILKAEGMAVTAPDDSLEKIARQNRISPQNLYGLILRGIPDP